MFILMQQIIICIILLININQAQTGFMPVCAFNFYIYEKVYLLNFICYSFCILQKQE